MPGPDRVSLFLCSLAAAGVLGLFGALFGAVVAHFTRLHGRAGGSLLGHLVVDAFNRVRREDLSELTATLLRGAVDGGAFLAVVGCGLGLWAGFAGFGPGQVLLTTSVGAGLLVGTAIIFGLLGHFLASTGVRAVVMLFAGGMIGATVGGYVAGDDGLFLGIVLGALLGAIFSLPPRRPPSEPDSETEPEP